MNSVIFKLLPYSESGIITRRENDTLIISGFRSDVDLEALQAELEVEWLDIVRQEAMLRVRGAAEARAQALHPSEFADLMAKLQLGRIKPEDQQRLNAYYDALDALDEERSALEAAIAAASVAELNAIAWPEWVQWEPIPEAPELILEAEPRPEAPGETEGGA